MAWLTHTDPFLRAALWIGLAATGLIALLILQIALLRLRLLSRRRRSAQVVARWRPVVNAVLSGERPRDLPGLERAEEADFFKLWLHFQASLRGEARAALNWLATDLGCEQIALRLLARGDRGERLLAILVLGHLGRAGAGLRLQETALSSDRLLAVHASLALVQIDPALAAASMAPGLVHNPAWPVREVVTVLQGAREQCASVMHALLARCDASALPRLLQVMEGLRVAVPGKDLQRLLAHESVEVQIAVLRMVSEPAAREPVLSMLGHQDWRVRMHAAKALGRVGRREDVAALTQLLSDREWWVRYRSAQVIAGLPFVQPDDMRQLAQAATDRFAGDMLRQVMAEGAMAA
ncbi:HEAT repeat domain-containing protein [Massilia sp. PAMC28688]|uniref:HEAT repeat domain-containing protein n=1 Tax=Massilia sp. PAMC28688 TaxID=2861283 RepID=UPI001C631092|nr:HEAT repeat domain-containing protein [Massilia sp. PAMC28688]QYF92478.1 HEAT repeat domain-containing protein [Massilia sp. PAMC28688]